MRKTPPVMPPDFEPIEGEADENTAARLTIYNRAVRAYNAATAAITAARDRRERRKAKRMKENG